MLNEDLQSFGLSKGESNAYLALVKLGSSTVGPIVKESKIAYSKIYDVLNRLIRKGLITYIIKKKVRYFHALPPTRIRDYLDKKQNKIEQNKKKLNEILPKFNHLGLSSDNEAQIFIGKSGILSGYEKFLESIEIDKIVKFFYSYKEKYHENVKKFYNVDQDFKKLLKKFNKEKNIKWQGIATKISKKEMLQSIKYRKAPFPVPGNIDISPNVVFLTIWSDNPVGILINSQEVAENFQDYFDTIWSLSKDIN